MGNVFAIALPILTGMELPAFVRMVFNLKVEPVLAVQLTHIGTVLIVSAILILKWYRVFACL
jgi:hypothetical protein